ncbi:hypothetical protein [Streptomyces lucensis]|nr:hypothetical protein [Streptomyces lucensis]
MTRAAPAPTAPRPYGKVRAFCALALAVTALAAVGLWLKWAWEGDSFPVADPAVTADRLDGRAGEVYDALGLPDAHLDREWPGSGVEAEEDCYWTSGLSHLGDQLSDSPPHVKGVVTVRTEWALKGITAEAGQSALRRARTRLERQGWDATTSTAAGKVVSLEATPPGGGATVHVRTYPRGRLEVFATAGCTRLPEGVTTDTLGRVDLPPQRLPGRLRG